MAMSSTKLAIIVVVALVVCGVAIGGGYGIGSLTFKTTTPSPNTTPSNTTVPPAVSTTAHAEMIK